MPSEVSSLLEFELLGNGNILILPLYGACNYYRDNLILFNSQGQEISRTILPFPSQGIQITNIKAIGNNQFLIGWFSLIGSNHNTMLMDENWNIIWQQNSFSYGNVYDIEILPSGDFIVFTSVGILKIDISNGSVLNHYMPSGSFATKIQDNLFLSIDYWKNIHLIDTNFNLISDTFNLVGYFDNIYKISAIDTNKIAILGSYAGESRLSTFDFNFNLTDDITFDTTHHSIVDFDLSSSEIAIVGGEFIEYSTIPLFFLETSTLSLF